MYNTSYLSTHNFEHEIEEQVMKDFEGLLGGRQWIIVTGGAPTSPVVLSFLKRYILSISTHIGGASTAKYPMDMEPLKY